MDRFTEKLSDNTKPKTLGGRIRRLVKPNGIYKATILKEYNKLYDRLVEYEDLGVTPEQIRGIENALCKLIEMQPTTCNWHKVADGELPKGHYNPNRLFWCKQKGMGCQIFRYDEDGFYYYFGIRQKIGVDNEQISAWMELPEYKEEQP